MKIIHKIIYAVDYGKFMLSNFRGPRKSIEVNKELVKKYPEDVLFWMFLGHDYFKLKEYGNATHAYIKCCELNPNSILSNLTGEAYQHLEDYPKAAYFYRQALEEMNEEAEKKKKGLGKTEQTMVEQMNKYLDWYANYTERVDKS